MKKLLCILVVAAMSLSMQAGCGKKADNQNNQPTTAQTKEAYTGKLPLTKENVKLTFLTHQGADASFAIANAELPVYKKIAEVTNVTIDWQTIPTANYKEVLNTRLASGQKLPDIINMKDIDVTKMAKDGIIIPMDDLMKDNAPLTLGVFAKKGNESLRALWSSADDGKLYAIRSTVEPTTLQFNILINHVWREKLGIKEPTTTDEFYQMLKAFKDNDINGNGQKDEIPFATSRQGLYVLGNSFGLQMIWANGFQAGKDGKVTYDYIDPRYKDYLTYLNKLYKEELLDKEYTKNTAEMFYQKATNNQAGAIAYYATFTDKFSGLSPLTQDKTGKSRVFSVMSAPLKGPKGDQYMIARLVVGGDPTTITKDCSNKEVAMRLIDWLFAGQERNDMRFYGVEGITYKKEGDKIVKIENPKYNGWDQFVNSIGGSQPPHAHQQFPQVWYDQLQEFPYIVNADKAIQKYFISPIPPTPYTNDESTKSTKLMKDINTYKIEMMDKFITGKEPLTNFDKYVATMKSMGIEDVIKIEQTKYDRYMKSKGK